MLWTVTLRVIESSSFISFSLYKTGCFYVFTLQGKTVFSLPVSCRDYLLGKPFINKIFDKLGGSLFSQYGRVDT
jgi:hypothetical protein